MNYKITILGDIMLKKEMIDEDNKYNNIFVKVKEYLQKSNIVIGNLETPISHNANNKTEEYKFVSPIEFADAIKSAGISFVSTANNHCLDNGIEGLDETIDCLDEIGIEHVGTYKNEKTYVVKKINNKKIAIMANTYGTNAFSNKVYLRKNELDKIDLLQKQELNNIIIRWINNSDKIIAKCFRFIFRSIGLFEFDKPIYERKEKSMINNIKKDINIIRNKYKADYILMMMHDGGQNNLFPIKRTINRINRIKSLGIDALITNHEHMIHKVNTYNNKIVTYSLGNFTGITGVIKPPYNTYQAYSIGINIYFDESNIKYTFTIFKNVYNKELDCIQVNLLYDLINEESNSEKREKLIMDNNAIYSIVTGNNIVNKNVKIEYEL